jgi:fumarylpyruvate hydrolase
MPYVITPPALPCVAVYGQTETFPVHRIYCVGRNYQDHAMEMGHSGREAPFFFMKPADAVVSAQPDQVVTMPYPTLTNSLHHEVELVVAIGTGGSDIGVNDAERHVFGYAVGLDMTRRDLQNDLKKQGRPWCIAKGFDYSAPVGPITPAAQIAGMATAGISLQVNGQERQTGRVAQMIWNVPETISQISRAWTLQPGDLIFTGTPAGVGAVVRGDVLCACVTGLQSLRVRLE